MTRVLILIFCCYAFSARAETCAAMDGKPFPCSEWNAQPTQKIELPSLESGNHETYCKNETTKRGELDQRMYDYCLHLEKEGYLNLQSIVKEHVSIPDLATLLKKYTDYWTRRGLRRDSMIAYEMKHEVEGYLDIEYEMKQSNFSSEVFTDCQKSDRPSWSRIAYCYKRRMHIGNN